MSRFSKVVEDPTYEEPTFSESWVDLLDGYVTATQPVQTDIIEWLNEQIG